MIAIKYLAVILALIIGTPSIAYAGELDGKALWCPNVDTGFVFAGRQVTEYVVVGYSINTNDRGRYFFSGTSTVSWSTSLSGIRNLNRETLELTAHGQCELSSKQEIIVKLKAIIALAKKKNKL